MERRVPSQAQAHSALAQQHSLEFHPKAVRAHAQSRQVHAHGARESAAAPTPGQISQMFLFVGVVDRTSSCQSGPKRRPTGKKSGSMQCAGQLFVWSTKNDLRIDPRNEFTVLGLASIGDGHRRVAEEPWQNQHSPHPLPLPLPSPPPHFPPPHTQKTTVMLWTRARWTATPTKPNFCALLGTPKPRASCAAA